METYLEWRDVIDDMEADKDAKENSIPGTKKQKVIGYMDTMGLSEKAYQLLMEIAGYKVNWGKKKAGGDCSRLFVCDSCVNLTVFQLEYQAIFFLEYYPQI